MKKTEPVTLTRLVRRLTGRQQRMDRDAFQTALTWLEDIGYESGPIVSVGRGRPAKSLTEEQQRVLTEFWVAYSSAEKYSANRVIKAMNYALRRVQE